MKTTILYRSNHLPFAPYETSTQSTPQGERINSKSCVKESYYSENPAHTEKLFIMDIALIIIFIGLLSSCRVLAEDLYGRSFYSPRSTSLNAARDLVGYCNLFLKNRPCDQSWYAVSFGTLDYHQSFQRYRIASYYFNHDCIRLTGSMVEDRSEDDLLADYFGLSPKFIANNCFAPVIKSVYGEFDFDIAYKRFFARLQVPAVWTRWHFPIEETPYEVGTDTVYPAGYMGLGAVQAPGISFPQAMCGNLLFGDVTDPWQAGIDCGARHSGGMSDVRLALGMHVHETEWAGLDLSLLVIAPTSNRSQATYFFEPIRGNGRHTEVGICFDGRMLVWEKDGDKSVTIYATVNTTHIFEARERRSFDYCLNGFFSRYLLLKEFDDSGTYDGKLVPGINVTTLDCSVSNDVQIDLVIMGGFEHCGLELDCGYNAWIRTKEKLCITGSIPENRYGIKGIQNVYDELGNPDNKTQSTATIYGNNLTPEEQERTADPRTIFITTADLNPLSGASTSAFTNKIFGHVGYAWLCKSNRVKPYLGFGGEIEFEGVSPLHNVQANNNAVAQWGVWGKTGVQF